MWWKLGALALLAVGFAALWMTPTETIEVTVETPRRNGAAVAELDADAVALAATLFSYGVMAAVLGLIGWAMWRVVRQHRKPQQEP